MIIAHVTGDATGLRHSRKPVERSPSLPPYGMPVSVATRAMDAVARGLRRVSACCGDREPRQWALQQSARSRNTE
jgi:hypothetical protein